VGGIVRARVASEIEILVDDLDPVFYEQIRAALDFENEEREKAISLRLPGAWELPKTITMYREERRRGGDQVLCLPRGFAAQLAVGAQHHDLQIQWDDKRSTAPSAPGYFRPFALRDYQFKAVMDLLSAEQGIYRAPAGSGKTTSILGLAAHAQQKMLVIIDKAFLLEQWRERASQFLGLSLDLDDERSVGKIGQDVWEERDLTIALRQTLFSRLWETKATKVFSGYGITILDESQHAGSAETLQEVVRDIPTKMLFGVSATPARTPMQGKVVGALIGPIVAETTRQELYDRGILVRPSFKVIDTEFAADFWKDHDSDLDGNCDVPGCKKTFQHGHRNNYSSVLKSLVNDEDRNKLIAQQIFSERGHVHLVPSRQLGHLNLLKRALEEEGWDGPIYLLRGEENAAGDSQKIVKAVEAGGHWVSPAKARKITKRTVEKMRAEAEANGEEFVDPNEAPWVQVAPIGEHGHEAVILSTVADEGFDVPMVDRMWIVFPIRQEAAVIQLIGRCERVSPGKKDAIVNDIRDPRCTIFAEQASERLRVCRYQGLREEVKHESTSSLRV
jgi:hypothetical protein